MNNSNDKVLIASSDMTKAYMTSKTLLSQGKETVVVFDGKEVIEVLEAQRQITSMIIDDELPGMDIWTILDLCYDNYDGFNHITSIVVGNKGKDYESALRAWTKNVRVRYVDGPFAYEKAIEILLKEKETS